MFQREMSENNPKVQTRKMKPESAGFSHERMTLDLEDGSRSTTGTHLLQMQKYLGNRATGRFIRSSRKMNHTGLPDKLRAGIESLSGLDMSDVQVYRNSSSPILFNALAYTQGTEIHLGPGQDKYLPHEAWHVVQQKLERVLPTMNLGEGVKISDDTGLEREADVMGKKALQVQNPPNIFLNKPVQKGLQSQLVFLKEIPAGYGKYSGLDPLKKDGNSKILELVRSEDKDLVLTIRIREWLRAQKHFPEDQDWPTYSLLLDEVDKIVSYLKRVKEKDRRIINLDRVLDEKLYQSFLNNLDADSPVVEKYKTAVDYLYRLALGNSNELGFLLDLSEELIDEHEIDIIVMKSTTFTASSSDEDAAGEYVPTSDTRKGRLRLAAGVDTVDLAQTLAHELMHLILTQKLGNTSLPYKEGKGNLILLGEALDEWEERANNFKGKCPEILKYVGRTATAATKIEKVLNHLLTYKAAIGGVERLRKELYSHFIEIYFIMRQHGVDSLDINFALREDLPHVWNYYVNITKAQLNDNQGY